MSFFERYGINFLDDSSSEDEEEKNEKPVSPGVTKLEGNNNIIFLIILLP